MGTNKVDIIYRMSQEECARLRENVPNVKVHRYNPKYLYPKLNVQEVIEGKIFIDKP